MQRRAPDGMMALAGSQDSEFNWHHRRPAGCRTYGTDIPARDTRTYFHGQLATDLTLAGPHVDRRVAFQSFNAIEALGDSLVQVLFRYILAQANKALAVVRLLLGRAERMRHQTMWNKSHTSVAVAGRAGCTGDERTRSLRRKTRYGTFGFAERAADGFPHVAAVYHPGAV